MNTHTNDEAREILIDNEISKSNAEKIIAHHERAFAFSGTAYTSEDMVNACEEDLGNLRVGRPFCFEYPENQDMSETEVTATEPATDPKDIVSLEGRAKVWHDSVIRPLQALVTESKGLTIAGHIGGEKEGFNVVKAMRLRIRSNRLPIQNEAKAMKDIARAIVKTVGQYEDELIAIISPEEKRLEQEEDVYEAKQAQIKREAEDLKKRITAARFIQMQDLQVTPLDYDLCQTATETTWDLYVAQWTQQKADKDAKVEVARLAEIAREAAEKAEADAKKAAEDEKRAEEAEERRLAAVAREAAKKAEADAKKAAEDEKRAEEAEERRLAAVALAAERAENARLKVEMEKLKCEKALPQLITPEGVGVAIETLSLPVVDLLSVEEATPLAVNFYPEPIEIFNPHDNTFTRNQDKSVAECRVKNDSDELNQLNDWRMAVRAAVERVYTPTFNEGITKDVFESEYNTLTNALPEIYPFI